MQGFDIKGVRFKAPEEAELLTGEYVKGLDPASDINSNAEVEKSEFLQFPDGTVQEAKGETHENGGVKMHLPDGTKVLSDNLTLTKEDVKMLREEHDIKASTSDTFASALEKYIKKIGLEKLYEEQEEIFETLKEQLEDKTIKEGTLNVNKEYISKKIYDIEQQKNPKEKLKADMFNTLFDKQESQKKPEKQESEAKFKYGGVSRASFDALCQKHGMSPDEGIKMLEDGGILVPKYQDAGIFVADDKNLPTGANLTPEQKEGLITYYDKYNKPLAVSLKSGKIKWEDLVFNKTLTNEVLDPAFLKTVQVGHQPKDKTTEYLPQAKTYGDLSQGRVGDFVLKEYYEATNKGEGKKFEDITPEEVGALQRQYNADLQRAQGINYFSGVRGEGEIEDKNFGNRTSSYIRGVKTLKGTKPGTIDVDKLFSMKPEDIDKALKEYGLTQKDIAPYQNSAYKYIKIGSPEIVEEEEIKDDKDPLNKEGEISQKAQLPKKKYPTMFFNPDQSVLPPSPQQAETMATNRFQRIDPLRIGIEDTLRQLSDSRQFVSDQMDTLPPTQRAAAMSSLLAQTQAAENEAFLKTNQTNAQYQASAEMFNIGQAEKEDISRTNNLLNYEARALQGAAKTEEDFRNYFDFNRKMALNNYNTQRNLNLLNSLFPDYQLNFTGTQVDYDPSSEFSVENRDNVIATMGNIYNQGK